MSDSQIASSETKRNGAEVVSDTKSFFDVKLHSKTLRQDKEAILSKIGPSPEIAKFNERLQQLLLGSKGLLAGWLDGQKLLQEVGTIAARARARCQLLRTIQLTVVRLLLCRSRCR